MILEGHARANGGAELRPRTFLLFRCSEYRGQFRRELERRQNDPYLPSTRMVYGWVGYGEG